MGWSSTVARSHCKNERGLVFICKMHATSQLVVQRKEKSSELLVFPLGKKETMGEGAWLRSWTKNTRGVRLTSFHDQYREGKKERETIWAFNPQNRLKIKQSQDNQMIRT